MTDLERKFLEALTKIVNQVDDGPAHCVGREASGNLVWKGSFLSRIEDARDLLLNGAE